MATQIFTIADIIEHIVTQTSAQQILIDRYFLQTHAWVVKDHSSKYMRGNSKPAYDFLRNYETSVRFFTIDKFLEPGSPIPNEELPQAQPECKENFFLLFNQVKQHFSRCAKPAMHLGMAAVYKTAFEEPTAICTLDGELRRGTHASYMTLCHKVNKQPEFEIAPSFVSLLST